MDIVYISDDDDELPALHTSHATEEDFYDSIIDMTTCDRDSDDFLEEPINFSQSIRMTGQSKSDVIIEREVVVDSEEELEELPHFVSLQQLRKLYDAHSIRLLSYLEEHFILPK